MQKSEAQGQRQVSHFLWARGLMGGRDRCPEDSGDFRFQIADFRFETGWAGEWSLAFAVGGGLVRSSDDRKGTLFRGPLSFQPACGSDVYPNQPQNIWMKLGLATGCSTV